MHMDHWWSIIAIKLRENVKLLQNMVRNLELAIHQDRIPDKYTYNGH